MRRILYVTGSRADFGLMEATLQRLARSEGIALSVLVTGAHLVGRGMRTVADIERSGLTIAAQVPVKQGKPSGRLMAENTGLMLSGMAKVFEGERPDLVLLLGDRGEVLAAATAALYLNIPVAHIHGGERSGSVDEPVRHAISKLSHIHLVATEESRERLVRMGERAEHVHVVGAPGLDGIIEQASKDRATIAQELGLDATRKLALFLMHPVVQEPEAGPEAVGHAMWAFGAAGYEVLVMLPNTDSGGAPLRVAMLKWEGRKGVAIASHLTRADYLSFLAAADVMVGNSSSGIIEAASFGTPVINIGSRQNLRQRSANTIDVPIDATAIQSALNTVATTPRAAVVNVYGDGLAGERIAKLLSSIPLGPELLGKFNAY